VGNSYNIPVAADDPSWQSMDFMQEHKYGLGDWSSYMKRQTDQARLQAAKPFFFGEYGISGDVPDKDGVHFHDGLWGGLMSGGAATGMLWWWDQYIEARNLYGQFGALARFLSGEDLAGDALTPADVEKRSGIRIYRLSGPDRSLVWIKDSRYSFQGLQDMAMGVGLDNVVFPTLEGFSWQAPVGAASGDAARWRVELWNPQDGTMISAQTLESDKGVLTIDVPSFSKDLAYKIIRQLQ
jgi:hypothetical protein